MKMCNEHPYQKIPEACRTTGLSQYYLRRGCRAGSIPHIRSGRTFYVDVPALLDKLAAEGARQRWIAEQLKKGMED